MTDSTHLDDDTLSAIVDGEGSPDDLAHIASCEACEARVGARRAAAQLVATPVPPVADAEREDTIRAALAAPSNIVSLAPRRRVPAWLGAAAAVATLAAGATILANRDGSRPSPSAARATSEDSGATADRSVGALAAPVGDAAVDGGDLGDVKDADLRARIDGALNASQQRAAAPSGADAAGGTAATACETEVRSTNPDLGPLRFRAFGTYEGAAVSVLAFDVGHRRWVYVVTVDGCAVKNQTTYAV